MNGFEAVTDLRVPLTDEIEDAPDGAPGALRMLPLEELVVDRRYQRDVPHRGRQNIRRIAERFDWRKFQPLIVAPADGLEGFYAIIDGQHRAIAAASRGDVGHVPCYVLEASVTLQARIYRDVNVVVTAMNRLQIHHAGVRAGAPEAVGVDNVCRSAGVVMLRHNKARNLMAPNETVAVRQIQSDLRRHGYDIVRRVLAALRRHNDEASESALGAQNIRMLCRALVRLPEVPDVALDRTLAEAEPEEVRDRFSRDDTRIGKAADRAVDHLVSRLELHGRQEDAA